MLIPPSGMVVSDPDFRLAFEERFFDVDGDGRHQSVTDVSVIEVLA